MCQEFPGSPPAIINKDADSTGDLQSISPESSLAYRRRVLLLGGTGSGKTSLAKSLASGSSQTSDGTTESLDVHVWSPFHGTTYENLLENEPTGYERSMVLDVWDLAGRKVWQKFHHLFLTPATLPVIVFNLADQESCEEVAKIVDLIWAKVPSSRIVIIGTHVDKLSQEERNADKCQDVLGILRNRHAHCIQKIQQEVHNLRNLSETARTPKCNQRMRHLEELLQRFPSPPTSIIRCSSKTAKGLDDVRRDILQAVLDTSRQYSVEQSMPIRPVTADVYDDIINLRKESNVVVSARDVHELFAKHEVGLSKEVEADEVAFLETSGVTQCISGLSGIDEDNLVCINPPALAKALCLVHMSDTKKAFRFEAKRFWPKSESGNSKKPNPAVLVQALEEVATEGLVRESMFPLLWQDLNMNEKQTKLVLDLMARLGLLNRAADAHGDAEKKCLELPNYPGLLAKIQHRLPLLGLTPDTGPTLNWTPRPFKGDAQIGWRYTFPLGTPPGLVPRLLVMCRTNTPGAMYRHHWKNGVLLKMGQVSVNIKQPDTGQLERVDLYVRVTVDEEGEKRATEVLWTVLARFLVVAERFLASWPGLYYQVSVLPSSMYYRSESIMEELEIALLDVIRESAARKKTMDVCIKDQKCKVNVDCLLPLPGEADLSITRWLDWLANLDIQLSESTPSIQEPDDQPSSRNSSQSSLQPSGSPPRPSPSPPRGDSPRVLTSPPVKTNKKAEIKWKLDNGWRRVSMEDELKEIKKVAASFVAAILAGAVAQLITEQSRTEDRGRTLMEKEAKHAAALASARAAQAAQSGNAEAAAMAVVAAAQAMDNAMLVRKKGSKGTTMIKSRMCTIM
ncbi:malignant fibrous histiocytoma-amplified sequence 1-like [Acanthaster planci]|uniref:Malignant fibrous histiocytoma-amplified sequence 1-like n=1 Tax=Acanthaster planci TaxID=133434 RepID=A0A8B7YZU8_ACAPL|nr:malignant fibrous histiocytoma-amplified sequence 1-like [Acanthaster planci]